MSASTWRHLTLAHYRDAQKTLGLDILYRGFRGPLHLLVDSTYIKAEGEGEWSARKCDDAIADRSAHVVIPPRRNARPWNTVTAGAGARNEALRAAKY